MDGSVGVKGWTAPDCGGGSSQGAVPHRGAGTRVADIVNERDTPVCPATATLAVAAAMLMSSGRTSAVVVAEDGSPEAVLTENDFLEAYEAGTPSDLPVEAWLQTGRARLPGYALEALSVSPSASLLEAAAQMRAQAGSDFAARHLLVREAEGGPAHGVLSALDLARALCGTAVAELVRGRRVGQAMKTRQTLPAVAATASLDEAFRALVASRQNCVLLADEKQQGPGVLDVVTPRDVLWAFVAGLPRDTPARAWLQGSQRSLWPRIVREDTSLVEAAAAMVSHGVHHLVVASPANSEVIVGVISSSDLAGVISSVAPGSLAGA